MSDPVRTAVIPAAGLGTRFLPVTKTIPKEMLPILGRPMIQYIVQEVVDAGIDRIIMVVSLEKQAIQDYFSRTPELEQELLDMGKGIEAREVQRLAELAEFSFVTQDKQLGLGHAILCSKEAVGQHPFAVILPDDLILDTQPTLLQMLHARGQRWGNYIAVEEVPPESVSAYGIIKGIPLEERVYQVGQVVEKPSVEEAPSNLGIVGRYILEPEIFACLERTQPGAIGEIQLTDGIALLLQTQPVFAYRFRGTRHDCGNPMGLLRASLEIALQQESTAIPLRRWLQERDC